MQVKQKDIVLISFPFSNQNGSKVRPGLVISNNNFNKYSNDCLIIPMTTVLKDVKYSFEIDTENLDSGKLIKKSRIRVDKITPIEKSLIKMKIATANNEILDKIKNIVIEMI